MMSTTENLCSHSLSSSGGEPQQTQISGLVSGHETSSQDNPDGDSIMLLEPRPFRPFKTSEEYLYAMREDLAEWLHNLYNLNINVDNFFEVLETGEIVCAHANNVRRLAEEQRQQQHHDNLQGHVASPGGGGRKFSSKWEIPPYDVVYRSDVTAGSFFARDNVHNFITWCRDLGIHEVLLFETDDLVLRKNEKHVILSLLEVARRGARFGMAAPLLVQMEADIDRELEQERLAEERMAESGGQFNEDDDWANGGHDLTPPEPPKVYYGPQAQIITNDLKSLDEMVRDLVERCSCPSQFPMVKVSEGKYRIGDTKVLIFVRILRNHVMVRVGGGWDTLEHYLDKHDPCRCRQGHRVALGSRVGFKTSNSGQDRQLMNVTYDSQKSSGGHILSVQNTTFRVAQQQTHEDGRLLRKQSSASLRTALVTPESPKVISSKAKTSIEHVPLSGRRSSKIVNDVDRAYVMHSNVEKEVHNYLTEKEAVNMAPSKNIMQKPKPSLPRQKSTTELSSTPSRTSPKKLNKSKSAFINVNKVSNPQSGGILPRKTRSLKQDKTLSKGSSIDQTPGTSLEKSRSRTSQLDSYAEQYNCESHSLSSSLQTRITQSTELMPVQIVEKTKVGSMHLPKQSRGMSALSPSKLLVPIKTNSQVLNGSTSEKIREGLTKMSASRKISMPVLSTSTQSSPRKGAQVSKIAAPKSRKSDIPQSPVNKDPSIPHKMLQKSKSEVSLNLTDVKRCDSPDRDSSQTLQTRRTQYVSPSKVSFNNSQQAKSANTTPKRKAGVIYQSQTQSVFSKELLPYLQDTSIKGLQTQNSSPKRERSLPKSSIPVLSGGSALKYQNKKDTGHLKHNSEDKQQKNVSPKSMV